MLFGALALGACGAPVQPVAPLATRPEGEGWSEFSLADFPALEAPGGSAVLQRPEALLDVVVLRRADGSLAAVWQVCTHGACNVEAKEGEVFECPCHGSRFAVDGAVLVGPATRPLRRFEAVQVGASLFLRRA